MAEGLYIYESHLGGFYTSPIPYPDDCLCCESCGDSDQEVGYARNRAEAKRLIQAYSRSLTKSDINEFLDKNFPKEADT